MHLAAGFPVTCEHLSRILISAGNLASLEWVLSFVEQYSLNPIEVLGNLSVEGRVFARVAEFDKARDSINGPSPIPKADQRRPGISKAWHS